jgi:hypothetical protein
MAPVTSKGEVDLLSVAETSDGDLSAVANKNKFVKLTATGIVLCSVLNERIYGVLTNKPATGKSAQIQIAGVAKVQAGAAVAKGDLVKTDATGRAITQTAEAVGVQVYTFGMALEAAGAAGDLIAVAIRPAITNLAIT